MRKATQNPGFIANRPGVMPSFQKECQYRPLMTSSGQAGALVTVSSRIAELGTRDDRPTAKVELTVRSNVFRPDPSFTFSQTVLGIQVLALNQVDLIGYSPKYTPPERSYTCGAKSTHTTTKTQTTQTSQTNSTAISTNLALSKSTLFSIAGTQTKAFSYLQASAATDTETKEDGVSVTLVQSHSHLQISPFCCH